MDRIDFRSDTVTWPTPAMREAMRSARVGDDVYGEDPTVNELEETAAARLGKEAGLFVASGTMGNLAAILTHAQRGDEAILGADAHVFMWEPGGLTALGGIVPRPLPTDGQGRMDPAEVEAAVRPDDPHLPRSRLVLVENTYLARNGAPLAPEYFDAIRKAADRHGLAVHLDGARLFNAAVALGADPRDLTRSVDSATFCLSKGLCAPVGSVLCGSRKFVHQARRVRKTLGGGMRQAGVIAAAGLVALKEMVPRLAEDHTRARRLADGLARIPGVIAEPETVRTNVVFFNLALDCPLDGNALVRRLREEFRIWVGGEGRKRLRAVTHYWVGDKEVDALVEAVRKTLASA
ncbi:MAG: DegT/DnrJ/EryC1/StrS family aminotransferase [Acidobacteria bacterium]|nr:DegT/DnrJ/EryC1/StrS family aminotransferase [Acidobacteriota bacterium]